MTREEAIAILRCEKDGNAAEALEIVLRIAEAQPCEAVSREALNKMQYYYDDCAKTSEYTRLGFKTAMEVVRTLPSVAPAADCVSREAVINAIHANSVWENEYNLTSSRIEKAVETLPSVTPTLPEGEWVEHKEGYISCSECGCVAQRIEFADKMIWKKSNFCPDCGRRMRGGE